MRYSFIHRIEYNKFYSDIGLTVSYAEKFDFYLEEELCATLIDYEGKAIGFFREGQQFSSDKIPWLSNACNFIIHDQLEKTFAKGLKENRLIRKDLYSVELYESGKVYYLQTLRKRAAATGFNTNVVFMEEFAPSPACSIMARPDIPKGVRSSIFKPLPFEGFVEISNDLPKESVFPFMLMLNRYEEDRKSD